MCSRNMKRLKTLFCSILSEYILISEKLSLEIMRNGVSKPLNIKIFSVRYPRPPLAAHSFSAPSNYSFSVFHKTYVLRQEKVTVTNNVTEKHKIA